METLRDKLKITMYKRKNKLLVLEANNYLGKLSIQPLKVFTDFIIRILKIYI